MQMLNTITQLWQYSIWIKKIIVAFLSFIECCRQTYFCCGISTKIIKKLQRCLSLLCDHQIIVSCLSQDLIVLRWDSTFLPKPPHNTFVNLVISKSDLQYWMVCLNNVHRSIYPVIEEIFLCIAETKFAIKFCGTFKETNQAWTIVSSALFWFDAVFLLNFCSSKSPMCESCAKGQPFPLYVTSTELSHVQENPHKWLHYVRYISYEYPDDISVKDCKCNNFALMTSWNIIKHKTYME